MDGIRLPNRASTPTQSTPAPEIKVFVNGEEITLDVPAKLLGGRTLVPARAVAEAFGADVQWDSRTRTVTIAD